MDTRKFRSQHDEIMQRVGELRALVQAGVAANAGRIAEAIVGMSTTIKFHLAAEDAVLYPALASASDPAVSALSRSYQDEMQGLGGAYAAFASRWRVGDRIAAAPEAFREEANAVFKALHGRIQRENRELYPAAERLQVRSPA